MAKIVPRNGYDDSIADLLISKSINIDSNPIAGFILVSLTGENEIQGGIILANEDIVKVPSNWLSIII